jgi:putative ABC transport system permease protein
MPIPLIYNVRSVRARWASNLVAVLGIAGVVAVFVAMLAMARGFQRTLVDSGSPMNAIIMRGGATTEMESALTLDQLKVITDSPAVARNADGRPLASGEVVVVTAFHHKASDSEALAQVRGVSDQALKVHEGVRILQGRFLRPGMAELVAGKNASSMYTGFELGDTPRFGGRTWTVVGIMESGGSAYDSEVWADSVVLNQTYKRPDDLFSSITVRLTSPSVLGTLKDALGKDPRLTVSTEREVDYYAKQSRMVSTMIRVLGFLVAFIMGVGAVFGAFNTMYSAVSARSREIATLRALGFSSGSVVWAFIFESLFLALLGGLLGCILVLPMNGLTTSTVNWQTFSQLAFAFRVTPDLLVQGLLFALFMGFWGGLLPSLRAARLPIATALREL